MLLRDEIGPYLLVPLDELDAVRARLVELGVDFRDDEDATTCGGPVVAMLRFSEAVREEQLELALRSSR